MSDPARRRIPLRFGMALAAAALVLAPLSRATPVLPVIPSGNFKVTAYGAVGDSVHDNTPWIQNAIIAAEAAGGGTVEIPAASGTYLCGPISIGSNIDLQIDAGATLQMLPYGSYPLGGTVYTNFITFSGNNVELSGPGTIDGQGAAWWAAYNANNSIPHRPYMIEFANCNFVLIQNITLMNSPMFHVAFSSTSNVTATGVTITASSSSPNTDGIDPAGSHYLIENCSISNGDDCVCAKPQNVVCGDITVQNCAFGTGHGVSVGGETNDGLNGLTVNNCTFNGTTNGLRLKADPTEGGLVQNVTYSNLTMTNVQYPILFYSYYNEVGTPGETGGSNETTPAKVQSWNATPPDSAYDGYATTTMPAWKNITVTNLVSTNTTGGAGYSVIWGLPNAPVSNVTFTNVQISGETGFEIYNAQNVQFAGTTSIPNLILYNAQVVTAQPQPQAVSAGAGAAFTVAAAASSGAAGAITPAYRWSLNGQPLSDGARADGALVSGSGTASLLIVGAKSAEAGAYSAAVTQALDTFSGALVAGGNSATATTAAAALGVSGTANPGRLADFSVNASVTSAGLTLGFVSGGAGTSGSENLLLRASGPALAAFGVANYLPDPTLTVISQTNAQTVAQNAGWGSPSGNAAAVETAEAATGAFPWTNTASLDSGLVTSLPANGPGYAVDVAGKSGDSGTTLAEVWDDTAPYTVTTPRLVNLSCRQLLPSGKAGANLLTAGFIVGGTTAETVLIRASGPALSAFGITNFMPDPQVRVFPLGGATAIAADAGWGGSSAVAAAEAAVFAFPYTNPASADSALVITLPPGAYTAQATSVSGAAGQVMVEIFEVP